MKRKGFGSLVLLSVLLVSYALSPVAGHHDGLPAFLGVWARTASMSGHRVIDTSVTSGNVTVNLNVTDAHRGGFTGVNGFDITITYDPALFKAMATGISGFSVTGSAPAGSRLEPICPSIDGCIFDLTGRTIIAFRIDLDLSFDAATNTLSSTPGKSRVFVTVSGPNAAPDGIALRFRMEARSIESVVYDTDNDGVYDAGEPVIAGATPSVGAALEDDARIKFHDRSGNLAWAAGEGVVRTSAAGDTTYNPPTDRFVGGGVPPPAGQINLRDDARIKFVDLVNPAGNALDIGAPSGSSDIKIDQSASQLTVSGQQVRYIKLDGFFSNLASAPNYRVSVSPNGATVAPTQGATTAVTVDLPSGSPGPVTLTSRVVSPVRDSSGQPPEFPMSDTSIGVTFSPGSGSPTFISTMFITTTKDTLRGTHTIIVNATSTSISGGVTGIFILTVVFPPIDFTVSTSRNLVVLRPGENSPDVLFVDSNLNGRYDSGEPLVLDANLDLQTDIADRVVSVTPHRAPNPRIRFIDVNVNSAYDALLEEFVSYDSNGNGVYDSGEFFFGGVAPAIGTLLKLDTKIRFVDDFIVNNVWDLGETVVYDTNGSNAYDAGEPVIDGSPPAPGTATKQDPKLRYDDFNNNNVRDVRGEVLVFDANLDKTVNAGDTIVSSTPTRAPTLAELGKPLAEVMSVIGFIDANSNGAYDLGEKLILDSNKDGFADSFPAVGASLVDDAKIKYADTNNNSVRESIEAIVYDSNSNNEFDTGDILISGAAIALPAFRTTLRDLAQIKYVDSIVNGVWNQGEAVVIDQNNNNVYNSGEPVIAGDVLVSESPTRSPTGTEVGAALKGELGKALRIFGEIGQPLLTDPKIRFIDGNANGVYNLGEKLVFDANGDGVVQSTDTVVSESPPRAATGAELGAVLVSQTRVRFIDLNGNSAYGVGETLVLDAQPNAIVDSSDRVVSVSPDRTPIARIKFIDGAPGSGDLNRFNAGEKLVLDNDHNGVVSIGDTIVSTDPPTVVMAGNADIGKALLEVELVLTVTWVSPSVGTTLASDAKIRFIDANGNGAWNSGERIFYDPNSNGVYNVAEPMIAGAAPIIGSSSSADARIRFVDRNGNGVWDLNEYVNYDTNSNGTYDTGEPIVLGAGPEQVSLFPPNPHPLDSTLVTELARSSGDVSGPAVPGVETKTLATTVKLKTQTVSGTQPVWARLPVMHTISIGATSGVSGLAKTAPITLILAKEGYRTDLPFDYKLTVHSDTPLPAPAAASGIRVQLDKGQTVTLTLTVNVTQGMPQNVTITILTVDPSITITVTGITHSTTVLSSWVTTITIATTTLTPSVTGGYTIVTAGPGGGSPPTPADEVIKLCVLFRGDVNNDGTVNVSDLARVGASFLKSTGQPGFDPEADINKDGTVNVLDLVVVGAEFLKSC